MLRRSWRRLWGSGGGGSDSSIYIFLGEEERGGFLGLGSGVWVRVMCMNWVYWTGLYSSDAMSYCHLSTN